MRLFVSYNSKDQARVEPVVEAFCALRPDTQVYYAPHKNTLGAYWIRTLGEELAASDAMLLFLGSRVGPWQEVEFYDAFDRARADDRPRILPILLEDTTPGLHFLGQIHRIAARSLPPRAVVEAINAGLDAIDLPDAAPLWRETNPYNGLFSQGTSGAAYFFGREEKTAEILEVLRSGTGAVHMLVGNSGVGKSSIVNAGVVAALRSQVWPLDGVEWPAELAGSRAWLQLSMKPGEAPLKSLALAFARAWLDDPADRERQALKWVENFKAGSRLPDLVAATCEAVAASTDAPAPDRLMLNIDQCEELYARAEKSEARLFSQLIASGAQCRQLVTVASLRSDYYGQLQQDEALFGVTCRIDVPPMTRAQVIEVIRKPVAALGARFETDEIVPLIAEATTRDPGTLPLLSYMMADAWEAMRRDDAADGTLRFPLGMVDVARPLVARAERFLGENPDREAALKRLFTLRLAHVPKEGEPVRRRATARDCDRDGTEWRLATELAGPDWRLLSTSEGDGVPTAEVAHEALLRSWPRLQRWLDQERGFLIWKGELEAARKAWEAAADHERPKALLMGLALDNARKWRKTRGDDLGEDDLAFIAASLAHAIDQRRADRDRKRDLTRAEGSARRRGRRLTRGAVAATIVLAVLGGVASWQWSKAASALDAADAELFQRRVERARLMVNTVKPLLAEGQPDRALAVAVAAFPEEARDRWGDPNAASSASPVLAEALGAARIRRTIRGHEDWV